MLHTHRLCRLRPNLLGTDYVVGDVHGQWAMLQALLAAVGFDRSKDRLFSVGDLIDKGPDSEACLELLKTWRCFHAVLGNHEWMLRETHRGSKYAAALWERNEGDWLDQSDTIRFDWLRRLVDGMPIALEVPLRDGRRLGIIHAEVPRGWRWSEMKRLKPMPELATDYKAVDAWESALWARTGAVVAIALSERMLGDPIRISAKTALHYEAPVADIDLVISGHTPLPQRRPMLLANRLMIDTGAYMAKGRLTLVDPLNRRCWQVANPAINLELEVIEGSWPEGLSFEPARRLASGLPATEFKNDDG